jgi:hypothetical protein
MEIYKNTSENYAKGMKHRKMTIQLPCTAGVLNLWIATVFSMAHM